MASSPVEDFISALVKHAPAFGVEFTAEQQKRLGDYYRIVMAWNPRLHLVSPCSAVEFAVRHALESLTALPFLSEAARLLDVGSGAGLPAIPCLIMRPDIQATLIEASTKKAVFLREALRLVEANKRAKVVAERFEELTAPEADFVTCRALDRFTELFGKLLAWSPPAGTLLFFGGQSLKEQIEKAGLLYKPVLIPESERRFLFIIEAQHIDAGSDA